MHVHSNGKNVFFVGHGTHHWHSSDSGSSYTLASREDHNGKPVDLADVRLHPTNPEFLLGSGSSDGCSKSNARPAKKRYSSDDDDEEEERDADQEAIDKYCYRVLYSSEDGGETWKDIRHYVVQYEWAPEADGDDKMFYASIHEVQHKGNQRFGFWDPKVHFVRTNDFFETHYVVVPHGNRFIFGEHNYVFVAAVDRLRGNSVNLMVSKNKGTPKKFKRAKLPVEITEHSYTILDTSEGSVFLHVNHNIQSGGASTGNVYVSGADGLSYSLSLPFNHRDSDGKCDFEKVEGLEGIYLANFIDDDKDKDPEDQDDWDRPQTSAGTAPGERRQVGGARRKREQSGKSSAKIKSVITFDKGGIWSYLEAPKKDATGRLTNCRGGTGTDACHLHLHGITAEYGPFYSLSTATGIIMATGSLGTHLHERMGEINTYLSRDAGLTWMEVAKGSHIYEYGDHGGLIVMAFDEGPTDHVLYSWDEGLNWKPFYFGDEKIEVENVIIEPTATSIKFIVYGYKSDKDGVLISLDFNSLHQSECKGVDSPGDEDSDYELWTPSDGRLDGKCLMGHTTAYTRRRRDAACFNPEEHERVEEIEHCKCSEEDFECDFGYARSSQGGPCEKIKLPDSLKALDPTIPPSICVGHYYVSKGYRRVAGDTCRGGSRWDPVQVPCPSWIFGGGSASKMVLGVLFLIVLGMGAITFAGKYDIVPDFIIVFFQNFGFGRGGGGYAKLANLEDDFDLEDDEVGDAEEFVVPSRSSKKGKKKRKPVSKKGKRRKKYSSEDEDEDEVESDVDEESSDNEFEGEGGGQEMKTVTVDVPTLKPAENDK